jgi:hypothetical protein
LVSKQQLLHLVAQVVLVGEVLDNQAVEAVAEAVAVELVA